MLFKDIKPYRYSRRLSVLPGWIQRSLSNQIRTWGAPAGIAVKLSSSAASKTANTAYSKLTQPNTNQDFSNMNKINNDQNQIIFQQQLGQYQSGNSNNWGICGFSASICGSGSYDAFGKWS